MTHVTIKDIAKRLNISHSTVSRALRDHPDIRDETKALVLKTAEEMDYHPDMMAQNLKGRASTTIGVIVPQVKHVFFAAIMSGISNVMSKLGYTVMVCQSNEDFQQEVLNAKMLVSQRVAGVLISVSKTTEDKEHFELLQRRGIPIVFFDRVWEDLETSCVVFEDYAGAFAAVEHLIKQGFKKIGHLGGPMNLKISQNRYNGYKDALAKYDIPLDENLMVCCGLNEEHGLAGFNTLMEQSRGDIDAIFCVTDPVAIGAFRQIRQRGLKIGKDIALVGFSDSPETSLIDPPLTTVRQSAELMGETAATQLLKHIEAFKNQETLAETIQLKTELIIRESSLPR